MNAQVSGNQRNSLYSMSDLEMQVPSSLPPMPNPQLPTQTIRDFLPVSSVRLFTIRCLPVP